MENTKLVSMIEWLRNEAGRHNLPVQFGTPDAARADAVTLISLPVRVGGSGSVGEKADVLIALEDAWSAQKPSGQPDVLLVPVG